MYYEPLFLPYIAYTLFFVFVVAANHDAEELGCKKSNSAYAKIGKVGTTPSTTDIEASIHSVH